MGANAASPVDPVETARLRADVLQQRLGVYFRLMGAITAGMAVFGGFDALTGGGTAILIGGIAALIYLALFWLVRRRAPYLGMYGHLIVTGLCILYPTHLAGGYLIASVCILALVGFIDVITLSRIRDGMVAAIILSGMYLGLVMVESLEIIQYPNPRMRDLYAILSESNNTTNIPIIVLFTIICITLFAGLFGHISIDMLARLNAARQEAERANALKSNFLTTVSHDLRTPVNAIINLSQFMTQGDFGPINAEQQHYLKIITASGEQLMQQVTDLLDFARIDSGNIKIVPTRVDLQQTVRTVSEIAANLIGNKPLHLDVTLPADLPAVWADPSHVQRIMLNLLSNAIKFTPQGAVTLRAEHASDRVRVTITDSGPGIAPEDQARIFLPFEQTQDGKQAGGTGLGLAICHSLVLCNDGTINVESAPGQGSTFSFTLPVATHSGAALPSVPTVAAS
ncbi:MAG: hypothetical protein IT324_10480 [Anaerolineae bacterium]|nr:hypothetical protein [Anaerolineae bacterium]